MSIQGAISSIERAALIALYTNTAGDSWTVNSGWKTPPLDPVDGFALSGTEGGWYGITVASDHVSMIDLEANNLAGTLPSSLVNLTSMTSLHLGNNLITGSIPWQWGLSTSIMSINLNHNQLSGGIPPELVNMTALQYLDLHNNLLSGSIPTTLPPNLGTLLLQNNSFSNDIPTQLGSLTSLTCLRLSYNQLTGNIPAQLGNLTSLWYLELEHNLLTGNIPSGLGSLTQLRNLSLNSNSLIGSIPYQLGNLSNLLILYLFENQLDSSIPIQLGNLSLLNYLNLGSNQLTGSIPTQLGSLANLRELSLRSNQLNGSIPVELGSLANLQLLYLDDNQLNGAIPPQLGNLSAVTYMDLSSNMLAGAIPVSFLNLSSLVDNGLTIRYNALYTSDASLVAFLNVKSEQWSSFQTLAPANIEVRTLGSTSVQLTWTPITYTADTGAYRVLYGTASGGPYALYGLTTDKTVTSMDVTGLTPSTTYYFVMETVTFPHADNQNSVYSGQSAEVSGIAVAPGFTVTSPNGGETWTVGTHHNITWTTSGSIPDVKIDYSTDNGSLWIELVASTTNTGTYDWTIPNAPSTQCLVRVSDALETTVNDQSSATFTITLTPPTYYNSPSNRLYLTEVNWAAASGGGQWVSEVLLTDVSGGSTVQVTYHSGTTSHGPFTLWTNASGADASVKFSNILSTIDGLDSGTFVYYGTSGALEFATQDDSHLLQAAVRTFNGNYSRTFPALTDSDTNTANAARELLIPNISNNGSYRPSVVLFNPSSDSVTVNLFIYGTDGLQIGSTINRVLAGHEMNVVTAEVRANTYSNAIVRVKPTADSVGRVMASGQTANNVTNDPAAHLAVQGGLGFDNSPAQQKFLTEVNWAAASGGGQWVSEVQIVDLYGASSVQVYYFSGTTSHGPFTLWTNAGGGNCSATFANILQTIDGLDSSAFVYYGTSGALMFFTQDTSHVIQASVRTTNGNFSRTFPALGDVEANSADSTRQLVIPNICNNATYRPSVVLFNPATSDGVTVEVRVIGSNGAQIGSTITRTLAVGEMNVITSEVRANTYDTACIHVQVTGGDGRVLVSGQTANNTTNDPAAHVAVQKQ